MRLAAVTLRYAWQPAEAVRLAAGSSRTTHGARGSYKGKEAGDIRASGYVVHTLERFTARILACCEAELVRLGPAEARRHRE